MQYHDSKLGCNGCYVGKERSDSVYPSSEIHQGICGQGRYIYNFCSGRKTSQGIKLLRKGFRKNVDNKIKEAGLTPYFTDGTAGIEEADMIMVCKKCIMMRLNRNALMPGKTTVSGIRRKTTIPCILQRS